MHKQNFNKNKLTRQVPIRDEHQCSMIIDVEIKIINIINMDIDVVRV